MKNPINPILLFLLISSLVSHGAVTILGDNWDDIGADATKGLDTGNNAEKNATWEDRELISKKSRMGLMGFFY